MIKLTQINGRELIINAEIISHIEIAANPIITLTTGNKIVVQESVEEIIEKVLEYHRAISKERPSVS